MVKKLIKQKAWRDCLAWFLSLLMILSIVGPIPVAAESNNESHNNGNNLETETVAEAVYIDLRATGIAGDIFNEIGYEVPAGEISVDGHTLDRHTAMGSVAEYVYSEGINIEVKDWGWGITINQIGENPDDEGNWMYYVDGSSPWVGADQHVLSGGESVHFVNFNLDLYSLSLSLDKNEIEAGDTVTATVYYTDGDGVEVPAEEADIFVSDELDDWGSPVEADTDIRQTDGSGELSFTWNETGTFYLYAKWDGKSSQYQWPAASLTVGKKSMELDPLDDTWVKNGNTVLDALLKFQQADGSFWWQEDTPGFDDGKGSTAQSLAALVYLAYGESIKHNAGQDPDYDPDDPDPEHETLSRAVKKAVEWYQANHPAPDNWEGLPALRAAGEDLNSAPWQSTQEWRAEDPGFSAETGKYESDHIYYIFKLLSVGEEPENIWEGRNLFEELAAQQNPEDGSIGGLGKHIWAIVALDVGRELGKNVGSWSESANRQSAVNHLLEQQNQDGSFGAFSQLDFTGWALVALSNYMNDPEVDVDAAINNALAFLQGRQQNNGGFSMPGEWGAENANSNAAVISGLVAVGEDLAIEESAIQVDDAPLKITIPEGAARSRLNTTTTTEGDKETATLPSIEVEVASPLGNARLSIPQGTKVTGPGNWTGSIKLPEVKDNNSVSGGTVSAVIEVGFPDGQLDFDKPVSLTIPGQAGKSAGFTRGDDPVTEIDKVLTEDSQEYATSNLSKGEAGKIDVGDDLVIWTTHFTKFVAYAPDAPSPSPSPRPTPTAERVTLSVEARTIGKGDIISSTSVDLKDGDTAFSVLKRVADERGISVSGSANYVSGIDGINDFAHGPLSGWKYEVNGDFPSKGPGQYTLSDRDRLRWRYTTDGGEDLGADIPAQRTLEDDEDKEEVDDQEREEINEKLNKAGDSAADWLFAQLDYSWHDNQLDWSVFALARSGVEVPDEYRDLLLEYVADNEGEFRLVTNYARIALAAAAVGLNPADLAGYNLVEKIYSNEKMTNQGTNGPVFALIALDALNHQVPDEVLWSLNNSGKVYTVASLDHQVPDEALWNRERLVSWILEQQNKNGGFPLHKDGADSPSEVDVTAMVLQALANYRDQEAVEEAVESAMDWLSEQQLESGGFKALDEENCESVAQVIIALTALDIDPLEKRFLQEDGSLLSNLLSFAADDGGFAHTRGGESSTIATQQALMAIAAYQRWLEGESSLYDMTEKDIPERVEDEEEREKEPFTAYFQDEENISSWAVQGVRKAWAYGLMKGVSETEPRFEPKRELTRAEMTTLLVRLYEVQMQEEAEPYFVDVSPGDWYYKYVMVAREHGMVSGVSEDTFSPGRSVSREEIAVMLNRTLSLDAPGMDAATVKDFAQTSGWAESSVKAVFSSGILVGDGENFRPKDPVTREMAAVIMVRVYEDHLR